MVLFQAGIGGGSRQSIKKGPFDSVCILVVPALKEEGVGGDGGWRGWSLGLVIIGYTQNKTFCTINGMCPL